MNAKIKMTISAPHKKMDRNRAKSSLLVGGEAGPAEGKTGIGGGADGMMAGVLPPNKKKGRLIRSIRRASITCPRKNSTPTRKSNNIPSTEKNPRLSPAGNKLTTIPRINRKSRLYIPHCRYRFLE